MKEDAADRQNKDNRQPKCRFFYGVEMQGDSNDSYRFSIFLFLIACVVIGHEIIKQRFKNRTTLSDKLHIK